MDVSKINFCLKGIKLKMNSLEEQNIKSVIKEQIYDICLKTCDDGMDGTDVFPENPRLIGDRWVTECAC